MRLPLLGWPCENRPDWRDLDLEEQPTSKRRGTEMAKTAAGSGGGDWKKVVGVAIAGFTLVSLFQKEKWELEDVGKFLLAGTTVVAFLLA